MGQCRQAGVAPTSEQLISVYSFGPLPNDDRDFPTSGRQICRERRTSGWNCSTCVLLRKQTFSLSAGPRFAVIGLL